MNNTKNQKNLDEEMQTAFKRSSKLTRSPVGDGASAEKAEEQQAVAATAAETEEATALAAATSTSGTISDLSRAVATAAASANYQTENAAAFGKFGKGNKPYGDIRSFLSPAPATNNKDAHTTPSFAPENQIPEYARLSPRLEHIFNMRAQEEQKLERCQAVLRKMRRAVKTASNTNRDIKDGISQLDELIEVALSLRKTWKEKEGDMLIAKQAEKARQPDLNANETQTPLAAGKRLATSAAEAETKKKARDQSQAPEEGQNPEWQTANKRKKKKKPSENKQPKSRPESKKAVDDSQKRKRARKRIKPEAVLVKPSEGKSYAEVLKSLKNGTKLEDTGAEVTSMRKTKGGAILLELAKGGKKEQLCNVIRNALKDVAVVSDLKESATIEIRDLDSLTTDEEVAVAVKKIVSDPDIKVRLSKANSREQRRAFVHLSADAARTIVALGRIKIGWVSCRLKQLEDVKRCFKCFGLGHTQANCKGPDRKGAGLCIRCGVVGHKMKGCTQTPKCCICTDAGSGTTDHIPGSRKCPARTISARK